MAMIESDVLVLGSGIAGLYFALKVAPYGSVVIVTKKSPADSNTNHAQGGIAAVVASTDSFDNHIKDTLDSGAGLARPDIVSKVIKAGPELIKDLVGFGIPFSRHAGGDFDLGNEGGHSARRVLHAGDMTGKEIESALLAAVAAHPNIRLYEHHFAIDLITTAKLGLSNPADPTSNICIGAYVLEEKTGAVLTFQSRTTLLATGGAGKVYLYTSNPDIATGDGMAMAYRAGAVMANMEFVQFHPTCLFHPQAKSFLISEAVRGEGGRLRLPNGERFMSRYDPAGELARRDTVARAIDSELKRTGSDFVLLDISHLGADFVLRRFPNLYKECLRWGYDMTREAIPVVPAAHYFCGGVLTDGVGHTSINNLYASGEVACTGLHGANRLASNSLLEALYFSRSASEAVIGQLKHHASARLPIPAWNAREAADSDEAVIISQNWDEIRRTMWNYVGIVRSDKRLSRALHRLELLKDEINEYYWNFVVTPDLLELRNLATVAELVVRSAISRRESRGLHFNLDVPEKLPAAHDTLLASGESTANQTLGWNYPLIPKFAG